MLFKDAAKTFQISRKTIIEWKKLKKGHFRRKAKRELAKRTSSTDSKSEIRGV
jgi:hypothetical protein